MTEESRQDPATWKTRLRCALNKSLEFNEETLRSQLDISEPYKVYRLVPTSEQGADAVYNGKLLQHTQLCPVVRLLFRVS